MPKQSEPSYYKPKDQRVYYLNYSIGGVRKRQRIPGVTTEAEARAAVEAFKRTVWPKLKADAADGLVDAQRDDPRLDELAAWYLDKHLPYMRRAAKTRTRYRAIINSFLDHCRATRRGRVSQIRWDAVEAWLSSDTLSASYKRDAVSIIQRWFTAAHDADRIAKMPVKKWIKPPKPRGHKSMHRALPLDELIAFVDCIKANAPPHIARPTLFIAYTGFHVGDVIRLTWSNIDRERGLISLTKVKGGGYLEFPINEWVDSILDELGKGGGADSHVFRTKSGEPWTQTNNLLQSMQRHAARGGHPEIVTFRDLRKTFGDLCAHGTFPYRKSTEKVDMGVLSRLMGHAKLETTQEHYTEVRAADLRDAVG